MKFFEELFIHRIIVISSFLINNTNDSLFHTFYNNKNDYNNTIKRKFKTTTLDDFRESGIDGVLLKQNVL